MFSNVITISLNKIQEERKKKKTLINLEQVLEFTLSSATIANRFPPFSFALL